MGAGAMVRRGTHRHLKLGQLATTVAVSGNQTNRSKIKKIEQRRIAPALLPASPFELTLVRRHLHFLPLQRLHHNPAQVITRLDHRLLHDTELIRAVVTRPYFESKLTQAELET
jgi:hypothetical protein